MGDTLRRRTVHGRQRTAGRSTFVPPFREAGGGGRWKRTTRGEKRGGDEMVGQNPGPVVTNETPLLRARIYRLLHASSERRAGRRGDPLSQMIDGLARGGVRFEGR